MAADIGVYGLGTMGSALALNLADKGFSVAVCNRETDWIAEFLAEAGALARHLTGCTSLEDFVTHLKAPRTILFMIPSGAPMDAMIDQIVPLLDRDDTLIDGGNADFNDTRRREAALRDRGINFVGMGVSGGEEGARTGPSMMVGGATDSWARFRPMAEAIAAKFEGDPCVAHLGPDGAGHFVKTVHNGIEYADMQMIAEIYGVLRDGGGWEAARIGEMLERWQDGPLQSFLMEISARALQTVDPKTGAPMVDQIVDRAGQKGTGRWTVIEALKLGQSASGIEAAVGARSWSSEAAARQTAEEVLPRPDVLGDLPNEADLHAAMRAGRILAHAQGFRVMAAASEAFDWSLDLPRIAEIWRAGCIIRSALLDDLADALRTEPDHGHLVLAPSMRDRLAETVPGLRRVVGYAVTSGLPVPALAATLGWYDSLSTARGTTNLIQAQRDIFGRHGFERRDAPGEKVNADWGG